MQAPWWNAKVELLQEHTVCVELMLVQTASGPHDIVSHGTENRPDSYIQLYARDISEEEG